jgi:TRAP-type C4-dicarboxylate transport system substrate-binding protein
MKNQKRIVLLASILMIISLSFFATAYAESKAKPMELKVATWNPPHIAPSVIVKKWAKAVEERSGGKVKFVFYWASSLAKLPDTFRATQTGLADVGMWVYGAVSGLTPLNEYISLPFMGFKDSPTVLKVYTEMRKRMPVLDAEFKGLVNLYSYPMPPYQIHTTKKIVRVPDDLRGMKLLADASSTDFLKHLGAVTVTKGPPDWYMSLQKGLVEGHLNHWAVVNAFKLEELFRHHTEIGLAGANSLMLSWWMNEDTWNKLPPETREAIIEIQPAIQQESLQMSLKLQEIGQEGARKAGHEIIELPPDEVELWVKATAPVREKWIADMEAKGKPGKAVYDEAQRLIAEYNQ